MARNRYGWEKRAKEMARKQKNEEKMRRRQGKISPAPAEEETNTADTEAQPESEVTPD